MQVTDDDLVRLELFDEVMSSLQNKISESRSSHMAFIKECHQAIAAVQQKLALDSQKTKMMVEQNVFASYLNQRLEQRNQNFFTNNFMHRNLFVTFIRQN